MAIRNSLRLLLLLLIVFCQFACQPQPVYSPPPDWAYADLRALDPADDIPPSQDLIALYIRRAGENIEIRLDFLDISTSLDCDLTLVIDSSPHGDKVTIDIPASGEISAWNATGQALTDVQPRVTRDTFLDTVIISLNRSSLALSGLPFQVQAFTAPAGSSTTSDRIGPVRSDASPPSQADILFAFWNTFQSGTPAQALRAWDGAHSGPGRSRSGLHNLLNAVKANAAPVFLLDLKNPAAVSVLDFMGVLPEIKSLAENQIAILPDVSRYEIPINPPASVNDSNPLGLSESRFLYTSNLNIQPGRAYRVLFIPASSLGLPSLPTYAYRWQDRILLPIPDQKDALASNMPTPDGPSLDLRRALIQSALAPRSNLFFLGGELGNTSWGDPACVSPTLHYLSAHPWMRFLTADDLLTLQPSSTPPLNTVTTQSITPLAAEILLTLQNAPPGPITDLAWQTFLSLLTPATPELTALRAGYFGIVGHLLVAARWAARSGSVTDCSVDIDWDGQAECILASPDFIATFEPTGGYMVEAFVRKADGVHQIIAPYAQFIVGLGDPSTWEPGLGSEGDPALVPGGFVDKSGPWKPEVQPGQITFTNADSTRQKIFRLTASSLRVEYKSDSPTTVQISLGLDPWRRFTTGWGNAYQETTFPGSWEWRLEPDLQVTITTSGTITTQAFTASRSYLSSPEDPNFDYPAGHFIPFPLALVEINGQDNFYIEMDVR